jgi:hypothetical protein
MTNDELYATANVACPTCRAPAGEKCVSMSVKHSVVPLARPHWLRTEVGARLRDALVERTENASG